MVAVAVKNQADQLLVEVVILLQLVLHKAIMVEVVECHQLEEEQAAVVVLERYEKLLVHQEVMAELVHMLLEQVLLGVMEQQVQLLMQDILLVVAVEDMKPIVDIMEKVAMAEAETQGQDQEHLQEMDKLELLTLVAVAAVDQEVLPEQTLVKKVEMVEVVL